MTFASWGAFLWLVFIALVIAGNLLLWGTGL